MGLCFSKAYTDRSLSTPASRVSLPGQSNGETIGLRQGSSPPVSPPRGHDATTVPANLDQFDEPVPARIPSNKPSTRSGRPNFARNVSSRPASASFYDSGGIRGWPASEGETSRKPSPRSNRSNPSSSHPRSQSFSVVTRPVTARHEAGSPRPAVKRSATRGNTGTLLPTMRELLPDGFRFRILVLGKRQSGKSTLIKSVLDVNMAAAPGSQHENADINVGFSPGDSRYLVVHEYSGFESGDAQSLQTIQDFISYRTHVNRSVSERLHAIWLCVPISDAIERGLGEGVEKILGMKNVPILIVFTKFDLLASREQVDNTRGDVQKHGDPRARARATCEDLCRSQFHKEPKDVPAVIVSEKQEYRNLIEELTSTTHRFVKADSHKPAGRFISSRVQLTRPPITPAFLAWSIAQRVDHEIIILASIEVGRSRYWRSLGSSPSFTGQSLESCVDVIHEDIINVWNFEDTGRYLSSKDFTARMTHLVGDMARSSVVSSSNSPNLSFNESSTPMAQWTNGSYQNNHKNIRSFMAYIVDLTVILHGLFRSSHSVSATDVQSATKDYAKTSARRQIHTEIRSFVTEIPFTYHEKDTIMEKIIDLINQNCVPTGGG